MNSAYSRYMKDVFRVRAIYRWLHEASIALFHYLYEINV